MDPDAPTPLLGGLTPRQFMRRHWQKKPLLVRQALPGIEPPVSRAELFALAASDGVESRLVARAFPGPAGARPAPRGGETGGQGRIGSSVAERWTLRHGPLPRRALPPLKRPGWTLLVQGLDLHVAAAHDLLQRFRFVPDARLDDLMVSWASDGGGVGPHLDSYDVFLVQVQGRRRWRIGRARDRSLVDGLPLKILRHFAPEDEWLLEPGDLLYLPPHWAHDGVAVGECMTASVGFRAPAAAEIAREMLLRLADSIEPGDDGRRYADPRQDATAAPGAIPPAMVDFARRALIDATADPRALERALGEALTEPKPRVWFEPSRRAKAGGGLRLDPRTRMMYDMHHVYINGESFRAAGRDATLMRRLADRRGLTAAEIARASAPAREAIADWVAAGWLHEADDGRR